MKVVPGNGDHLLSVAPSREVVVRLDALKEVLQAELQTLRSTMDERDRQYSERFTEARNFLASLADERLARYDERFKALIQTTDQRFNSMEEKTQLAFASSERAITKSETAAEKRFDSVNEFRGQLRDMIITLLPRPEADVKFKALDGAIDDLKQFRSQIAGKEVAQTSDKVDHQWSTGNTITLAIALMGWAITIFLFIATKH